MGKDEVSEGYEEIAKFSLNSLHYLQVKGTAMGIKDGPLPR